MNNKKQKDTKMQPQTEEKKISKEETKEPEVQEETKPDAKEQDLAAELAELKDKYLRTMAEFENYRRRTSAEKAEWIRQATKDLALHICDVLDNLERALIQASVEERESPFGKGIILIEKQLAKILEREGIKKIEALGQEFNPEYHEALAHIPSEYEENIVAAIIQNGYMMNDKVIRPVRVAVSNGKLMKTQEE
nr:molecular chaperone GrpE [Candidatus Cloacimonadota bacterium]